MNGGKIPAHCLLAANVRSRRCQHSGELGPAFWLWYVVEREIHHWAQLALYLNQLKFAPPFYAHALPSAMRPRIR
jgi:uncharacterized damage-inducible protein DinB